MGFYEDGAKRTLTDEQIAIFRHSEIQGLIRERNRAAENRTHSNDKDVDPTELEIPERADFIEKIDPHKKPLNKKARKALKAKLKGYFRPTEKPDLRKRTWDKVEVGLESLDYDEVDGQSNGKALPTAQRRRISYGE